jgi:hypothetical protein
MGSTSAALGARLKTHGAAKAKFWLVPLGIVMAAGGVFLTLGPWLYPDPRAGLGTQIGVSILGLFAVLLGVAGVVRVFLSRNRQVNVHEHGIAEERGTRRTEMRWDEVATLVSDRQQVTQAMGLVTHEIARHVLTTDTGRKIVLDHLLSDIASLGDLVEEQVSLCLLPKIRTRLGNGETVLFAPLEVSPQGLRRGQQTLPWDQVAGAQVAHGEVRIFRSGEPSAWVKIRYGGLSNASVLLTLISSRLGEKAS